MAIVRHDSAAPLMTAGADYLSQLLAGMLAAAQCVSDFFPGDRARLKTGGWTSRMRPASVLSRGGAPSRTWASSPRASVTSAAVHTANGFGRYFLE